MRADVVFRSWAQSPWGAGRGEGGGGRSSELGTPVLSCLGKERQAPRQHRDTAHVLGRRERHLTPGGDGATSRMSVRTRRPPCGPGESKGVPGQEPRGRGEGPGRALYCREGCRAHGPGGAEDRAVQSSPEQEAGVSSPRPDALLGCSLRRRRVPGAHTGTAMRMRILSPRASPVGAPRAGFLRHLLWSVPYAPGELR